MTFRMTWRGQREPGSFDSVEAAKAYAQANSVRNSIYDDDRLTWWREPEGSRGLWWGSDGYNNWWIYEDNDGE